VGPGAGLDRCGKSRPTGIRSPDLLARSESLYRLRYPGSQTLVEVSNVTLNEHNFRGFAVDISEETRRQT
jgi:hypothetical protein